MENVVAYIVKISQAFKKLEHVAFYLAFGEADVRVGEHATEVVVHVGGYHVEGCALFAGFGLFVDCCTSIVISMRA